MEEDFREPVVEASKKRPRMTPETSEYRGGVSLIARVKPENPLRSVSAIGGSLVRQD